MTEPRVTFLRGHESVNVAGESHYQDALRAISGQGEIRHDTEARLIPEPDNPHDANAVRVEIDGAKVGYLPRDLRRNGHHRWPSWRAGGGSAQPSALNVRPARETPSRSRPSDAARA